MPAYILKKYTYEDYKHWEGDWELIDEIPQAMTPSPVGKHQFVMGRIIYELNKKLDEINCNKCFVLGEIDYIISDELVYPNEKKVIFNENEIQKIQINSPYGKIEFESKNIFKGLN